MTSRSESNNLKSMEDELNMFFNIGVSRETEKNPFPWDSVSSYLKNHKEALLMLDNAKLFCDFFIKVLENHVCEETTVFNRIIDVMAVLMLEREEIFFPELGTPSDPYEEIFSSKREYHLDLSTFYLSKKKEKSVFNDGKCIEVVNALKNGNHRMIRVLATYGWNVKVFDDSLFAKKVASTLIRKFMNTLEFKCHDGHPRLEAIDSHFRFGFDEFIQIVNSSIENDPKLSNVLPNYYDLAYLLEDRLWRPKTIRFKRLFLLILGIYALTLKLQNNPEFTNFVKCLDIAFKTVCEPHLAVIEVRSLMFNYCKPLNKEYLLDEWCEVFKDTLPFCTRNYEPRSLSHLARCQVRENLRKSRRTLPAVLDRMEIPQKIKDFLLCNPCVTKA